jgi:hypothetical protein
VLWGETLWNGGEAKKHGAPQVVKSCEPVFAEPPDAAGLETGREIQREKLKMCQSLYSTSY